MPRPTVPPAKTSLAVRAVCLFTVLVVPLIAHAQLAPRSASTSRDEVDDAFISYLHGIIVGDWALDGSGEELQSGFPEFVPTRPTPFLDVERLSRTRHNRGGADPIPARLSIQFSVPLDYEVPVDIFGHHPVVLLGSRIISFDEVARGADGIPNTVTVPDDVSGIVVMRRSQGFMGVDFAGWLDFLSGRLIDDVDVTILAIVRYRGVWHGLLSGFSPEGRVMTGIINLQTSKFRVRPPRALTRLSRDLVSADWTVTR